MQNQGYKNEQGDIIELRCSYDPDTLGKNPAGRKVKGVIHWVSAKHAISAEIRLYDRLFTHPTPDNSKDGKGYTDHINPDSLRTLTHCYLEINLAGAEVGEGFQFEREGYFTLDATKTSDGRPVFNRTITLRDTWAKMQNK